MALLVGTDSFEKFDRNFSRISVASFVAESFSERTFKKSKMISILGFHVDDVRVFNQLLNGKVAAYLALN